MSRPVLPFALVTLMPLPLLGLGAVLGGFWIVLALAYMTVLTFALDRLIGAAGPAAPDREFPAANRLSVTLALAHFPLMALAVWSVSGHGDLGIGARIAAFFAFGLFFGQIGNSNAHELIHRPQRPLFTLGKWVFIAHLFGHHTSAHRLVHHRFVATPDDPNTARLGEGFYHFAPRAWIGSFRAGWQAEPRRGTPVHPYVIYTVGGAAFLALAGFAFGLPGLITYVALAAYATLQLLLSDYVQHYGLTRIPTPKGGFEPVTDRHSWNAGSWFSGHLMLNAPRHSDHHAHPIRAFPALRLPPPDQAPRLPAGLPAMATLALAPHLWRRVMDRRARRWRQTAAHEQVAGLATHDLAV